MGKKREVATVRLILEGGSATPGPPVGPALGQHGVNLMEFVKTFNALTASMRGQQVRVLVHIYEDRTFSVELKGPVTSFLLKQLAGIVKGSGTPNKEKVGKISRAQLVELARQRMKDMNCDSLEAAVRTLEGQCKSMGILVVD